MATTKSKTEQFYSEIETIKLDNCNLEVKFRKPGLVQISTLQSFIVDSFSKLKLTLNELNTLTYNEIRDKALTEFSSLNEQDRMNLFSEMLILEVDPLLKIIKDCFPEVDNPRVLTNTVLFDMVILLFSKLQNI